MIQKNRPKSSSLFLIELILAILFFSIASAVCVRFFVSSHLLGRRSDALTQAVNECSSVAEICRTSDSLTDTIALLEQEYPLAVLTETTATRARVQLYFDQDFSACRESLHHYELELTLSEEDFLLSVKMVFTDSSDDSVVYELETLHHVPRRRSHE